MKKPKALLLFSGGLDSMIAAKVLQDQNIDVTGISFHSYFFNTNQAERSAEEIDLELITRNFSKDHLDLVRNPKNFTGKGLNPCIDCHTLMLRVASEVAKKRAFDIIATGEVLGQRPLSQTKPSLFKVEKEAGLLKRVLRPLSAKLLSKTIYEKEELVSRKKLLEISGRGRKKQLALAKKFSIKKFPTPAGGCLLTEIEFSKKLKRLLENVTDPYPTDFELIKIGRHYWGKDILKDIFKDTHLILGRNKEENCLIEKLALKKDIIIKRKDTLGPTALIRSRKKFNEIRQQKIVEKVKKMILQRSKNRGPTENWYVRN